ncbi:unnamed protein product [Boreogadus saida]
MSASLFPRSEDGEAALSELRPASAAPQSSDIIRCKRGPSCWLKMAAENTHFCIHTALQPRVAPVQPPALRRTHWGNPHRTQRATAPSTPPPPPPATPPQGTSKGLRARPSDGALSSTEPGLISGEPDRVKPSITGQL